MNHYYYNLRWEDIAPVRKEYVTESEYTRLLEAMELDRRYKIFYDKYGKTKLTFHSSEGYVYITT